MSNPIAEVIGGLVAGFVAGVIGWTTDTAVGAIFNAFGTISAWFIVLGIIYAIVSFLMGISDAIIAGFCFTLGIIAAGAAVGDAVTILGGVISFGGLLLSLFRGGTSDLVQSRK